MRSQARLIEIVVLICLIIVGIVYMQTNASKSLNVGEEIDLKTFKKISHEFEDETFELLDRQAFNEVMH